VSGCRLKLCEYETVVITAHRVNIGASSVLNEYFSPFSLGRMVHKRLNEQNKDRKEMKVMHINRTNLIYFNIFDYENSSDVVSVVGVGSDH